MNYCKWGILNSKSINYKYITFLLNRNNKSCYDGRTFTYVIKYNDNVRFGASNQLYNRFQSYYNIYGDAQILKLTEHKNDLLNTYNTNMFQFMLKYTNNNNIINAREEETIVKMYDDIKTGKFSILYKD